MEVVVVVAPIERACAWRKTDRYSRSSNTLRLWWREGRGIRLERWCVYTHAHICVSRRVYHCTLSYNLETIVAVLTLSRTYICARPVSVRARAPKQKVFTELFTSSCVPYGSYNGLLRTGARVYTIGPLLAGVYDEPNEIITQKQTTPGPRRDGRELHELGRPVHVPPTSTYLVVRATNVCHIYSSVAAPAVSYLAYGVFARHEKGKTATQRRTP